MSLSVGFWTKVYFWFVNFIKLPGRVEQLAKNTERYKDNQRYCANCGTKLILRQSTTSLKENGTFGLYDCEPCENRFWFPVT